MLTTLNLRNFVIVEALTLDVRQGFTVSVSYTHLTLPTICSV